jgi:predicted nucleic acid-binding protein
LTGYVGVLPQMFESVVLPSTVQQELASLEAPLQVRNWIATPPGWIEILSTGEVARISGLHKGESAAIVLAQSLHADLLLIDERGCIQAGA